MNETKIFGNPIPLYLLAIAFGLWVSAEVVSSKLMVVLFGIYCLGQVVTMQIVRLTSTSMSFRDNLLKTKVEIDFEIEMSVDIIKFLCLPFSSGMSLRVTALSDWWNLRCMNFFV